MSLFLARNGHAGAVRRRLLLRVERTCRSSEPTSDFDPERTRTGGSFAMRRMVCVQSMLYHSPLFLGGNLMRRRKFIALLGSALVTWPVAARAQTVIRVRRIGVLSNSAEEDAEAAKRLAALKLRLQELGWIEGKNLQIEVRFGHNDGERIRRTATELIEVAPDRTVRLGRIEIPKQNFLTPPIRNTSAST
jgi:hypothetical protein